MAKSEKRRIGDIGEGVAAKYLENKGFFVVERNYWRPWGEIDLVAKRGGKLHFVEVKSVSREALGGGGVRPEENMHEAKLRRLHRAVQTYLIEKKVGDEVEWQIDLACVTLNIDTKRARVEVIENIVL
jgi:putative endonuclease